MDPHTGVGLIFSNLFLLPSIPIWGFPEIKGTLLGILIFIIRTVVFWGLHWGPAISGNSHILLIKP